jgi:hypothetical protein
MGNAELQERIRALAPAKVKAWVSCITPAVEVEIEGSDAILSIDIGPLQKLLAFVKEIDKSMRQLITDVEAHLAAVVTPTEVEEERQRADEAVRLMIATIDPTSTDQLEGGTHAGQAQ